MNNDQPSSPQPSLFDAKQQGRSRVKVAVFSVLAFHVAGLTTLLLTQGCKREVPPETELQPEVPMLDTNEFYTASNLPPELPPPDTTFMPPPGETPLPPVTPPPTTTPIAPQLSEYVVKSGDTYSSIAKNYGTTTKAIEAANPGVDPRRLQIGQKLVLPPPAPAPEMGVAPSVVEENVYVVKSGDTLTRIATRFNTTVKELKSLNGLTTDRINVGQKLKLPPPPAPAPVPISEPLPPAPVPPTTTGQ